MRRRLIPTAAFVRQVRRAGRQNAPVVAAIAEALARLEDDAFDPRLGTHKLAGGMVGLWACSVSYDLRIIFRFEQDAGAEVILMLAFGTHDEVS